MPKEGKIPPDAKLKATINRFNKEGRYTQKQYDKLSWGHLKQIGQYNHDNNHIYQSRVISSRPPLNGRLNGPKTRQPCKQGHARHERPPLAPITQSHGSMAGGNGASGAEKEKTPPRSSAKREREKPYRDSSGGPADLKRLADAPPPHNWTISPRYLQ